LFKKRPVQNAQVTRLTDKGDFCAGADAGRASFSPDGGSLAFWGAGSGLKQIYVLDVGADDSFDFRFSHPRIISNHQADDWDPLWIK
jgi:Tol biopolymer transport system component